MHLQLRLCPCSLRSRKEAVVTVLELSANQGDLVQQLVEMGIMRPNLIMAKLMEHRANDGFIWKVLVFAPEFDQSNFDLAAPTTSATYIEPLHNHDGTIPPQCLILSRDSGPAAHVHSIIAMRNVLPTGLSRAEKYPKPSCRRGWELRQQLNGPSMFPHNRLYLHCDFIQQLLPLQHAPGWSLGCFDKRILCCGKLMSSSFEFYLVELSLRAL